LPRNCDQLSAGVSCALVLSDNADNRIKSAEVSPFIFHLSFFIFHLYWQLKPPRRKVNRQGAKAETQRKTSTANMID
jgi:hypothetical protein